MKHHEMIAALRVLLMALASGAIRCMLGLLFLISTYQTMASVIHQSTNTNASHVWQATNTWTPPQRPTSSDQVFIDSSSVGIYCCQPEVDELLIGSKSSKCSLRIGPNDFYGYSGAALLSKSVNIRWQIDANNNSAYVSSAGYSWTNLESLIIGDNGSTNRLGVENATLVTGSVIVGKGTSSVKNEFYVVGDVTGSFPASCEINGNFIVGDFGKGWFWMNGKRTTLTSVNTTAGRNPGSFGEMQIGFGSIWTNTQSLTIGDGSLWIQGKSALYTGSAAIAINGTRESGIGATIDVNEDSTWNNYGLLVVGDFGYGDRLGIRTRSSVSCNSAIIGRGPQASGSSAVVSGSGSLWEVQETLTVGGAGINSKLAVYDGGRVNCSTYAQAPTAELVFRFGRTNAPQLNIATSATFEGSLTIDLQFTPNEGDIFTPITYGSHSGNFSSIKIRQPDPKIVLLTEFTEHALLLRAVKYQSRPDLVGRLCNGKICLDIRSDVGSECQVEASEDLSNWRAIGTVGFNGIPTATFEDNTSPPGQQYYRVRVLSDVHLGVQSTGDSRIRRGMDVYQMIPK